MTRYKYVIKRRCAHKITAFYRNVSKKYKHTYSLELHENGNVRNKCRMLEQNEDESEGFINTHIFRNNNTADSFV